MFLKIINLFNNKRIADYKGISLDLVIPGSQIYDFEKNLCYLETDENMTESKDELFSITEEEYTTLKESQNEKLAESEKSKIQEKETFVQTLATLTVESKKKDAMIKQLVQTVNDLTIKVNKLGGTV